MEINKQNLRREKFLSWLYLSLMFLCGSAFGLAVGFGI